MASTKIDMRPEMTLLATKHAEQAKRFNELRDEIDATSFGTSEIEIAERDLYYTTVARTRSFRLSDEFEAVKKEIRKLEGFEGFLKGFSDTDLMAIAAQGPIVVLNIAPLRSDALLVTKSGIKLLALFNLEYSELETKATAFQKALNTRKLSTHRVLKEKLRSLLEWLWDVAAGPVLDELGYKESPKAGDIWPRVWWVSSGLANVVPIHSAGYHEEGSGNTVLDRVISSYSPSIKALKYAREKGVWIQSNEAQKAVLVAMPETANKKSILSADIECTNLEQMMKPRLEVVTLRTPRKARVLKELSTCQIAHFACHGQSNMPDPSESRLLLDDWETDPLTVADITAMTLEKCQLAYLSACHAADNQAFSLLDEGLHLAGACQLAGFPHVVGSLWEIRDRVAADFAPLVYRNMMDELGKIDVSRSAQALHQAVIQLRYNTRHPIGFSRVDSDDPVIWAGYLHMGA
jgi:hypothetical protein